MCIQFFFQTISDSFYQNGTEVNKKTEQSNIKQTGSCHHLDVVYLLDNFITVNFFKLSLADKALSLVIKAIKIIQQAKDFV